MLQRANETKRKGTAMTMTIKEFCEKHLACREGREWAEGCGAEDMSELWQRDEMLWEWRLWIATRDGVLSRNEPLWYACWSVRQIWPLLGDPRSRAAIETVERFVEGKATPEEVVEARSAACAANAAAAAANAAAAALAKARAAQSQWLRENTSPNFASYMEDAVGSKGRGSSELSAEVVVPDVSAVPSCWSERNPISGAVVGVLALALAIALAMAMGE